ncbi:MAG: hypothetical protein FJW56_01960 [Actinobacteria bacterium]|nr:hypothetical protein [Actinomycetota bacterium]
MESEERKNWSLSDYDIALKKLNEIIENYKKSRQDNLKLLDQIELILMKNELTIKRLDGKNKKLSTIKINYVGTSEPYFSNHKVNKNNRKELIEKINNANEIAITDKNACEHDEEEMQFEHLEAIVRMLEIEHEFALKIFPDKNNPNDFEKNPFSDRKKLKDFLNDYLKNNEIDICSPDTNIYQLSKIIFRNSDRKYKTDSIRVTLQNMKNN